MTAPIWHAGEYVICAEDARQHAGELEALNEPRPSDDR